MNSRNKKKSFMYRILRFQEEEEEKTWMYSNSEELKSLEKKNPRHV
jgi:hypothetical protein